MQALGHKGPLKKGDVRQALDKRIIASRKVRAKLSPVGDEGGRVMEKAKESVLQSVRKELFGERLPKTDLAPVEKSGARR